MSIRVGSYNLRSHQAYQEASELVDQYDIDIMCLQECHPAEADDNLGRLALAGTSPLGKVGLAVYYDIDKFSPRHASRYQLPPAWYEHPSMASRYRLQLVRLMLRKNKEELVIGNVHLANLWAPNIARRHQLAAALQLTNDLRGNTPAVVAGDCNYPWPSDGLDQTITSLGFKECGEPYVSTHTSRLLKGRFDRVIATPDVTQQSFSVLPLGGSDHAPLVFEFKM